MLDSKQTMDVEALYRAVLKGARETFEAVQRDHSEETFYGFAFGTDCEALSFFAMANTEEGLARAAEDYAGNGSGDDLGLQRTVLRWSLWDWAYVFGEEDARFSDVHRILRESQDILLGAMEEEAFEAIKQVYATYIKVLRQLDSDGIFSSAEHRANIGLFITTNDCSIEETMAWTSQVNPEGVARRIENELEADGAAYRALLSARKAPKGSKLSLLE